MNIPSSLESTFAALKAENELKGLELEQFASRLAFFYSELDAIHPLGKVIAELFVSFLLIWRYPPAFDWRGRTSDYQMKLVNYFTFRDNAVMRGNRNELEKIDHIYSNQTDLSELDEVILKSC